MNAELMIDCGQAGAASGRSEEPGLRPATAADADRLFSWRNLPEIVALGSLRRTVAREEHNAWFAESLSGEKRSLFIIECAREPVGQLRFDWLTPAEAEISLYLLPGFTGRGLGVAAIQQGCQRAKELGRAAQIVAWVREENGRSVAAFGKAGFIDDTSSDGRPGFRRLVHQLLAVVPHNRLTFGLEEERAVTAVVRSGRWAGGAVLAEAEKQFARAAGVSDAIGVGSGIGALRLALLAVNVGPGDAVAVPAYSCVALANAVLACGARPVPVEIEPETWNLSVAAVRAVHAATPLKAAIAVHTFGCPARVREIEVLGVPVIEDCSHAFGRGALGRLGRVAMLSLYATKLLGAGEGGMIFTDDAELAERLRAARDYTDQAPAAGRLNDKLTDLEAALARCQLERLPDFLRRRDVLARNYTAALAPFAVEGSFTLPSDVDGRVWYRYAVAVSSADATVARMSAAGVTAVAPVDRWCDDLRDAPVSARAFREIISLPLYPTLTAAEQERVVNAFLGAVLSPAFT